jgi:hypothetical protein
MQWLNLLLPLCACSAAGIAVAWTIRVSRALSALAADFYTWRSKVETTTLSTSSSLIDLAEMRESLKRAEDLLVKVNRREIANAKTRSGNGTFEGATSKDRLRAMAGLRAGQVPRHE